MNTCWACSQEVGWTSDAELVRNCIYCGVENDRSLYEPLTKEPKEEGNVDLKNWSKENAKYIKIKDGESYEGIYKGCKPGVNMNGDPAVVYNFDGKEFKSSSTVLADIFAGIPEETKVKVSRIGDGLQTRWTVTLL